MKSVAVVFLAGCLSISCTFSGVPELRPPMVSVEHDEDFGPVPGDSMLDFIRQFAASRAVNRLGGRTPDWALGPDLTRAGAVGGGRANDLAAELRRAPSPRGSSLPDLPMGRSQEDVIAPGDELDVAVSGRLEFSGKVRVRSDGTVLLPTSGDVLTVGKLTVTEAASRVAAAVYPKYLRRRPDVSVVISESPRFNYYIFGAVARAGKYPLVPGEVRLLDAILAAGGASTGPGGGVSLHRFGAPRWRNVLVVTPRAGRPSRLVINVEMIVRGRLESNVVIRPGQVIYVPSSEDAIDEATLADIISGRRTGDGGE